MNPQFKKSIDEFMSLQKIEAEPGPRSHYLSKIIHECQAGLKGHPSSLEMLNTYTTRKVSSPEALSLKLIIDAGGTNFRVVVMKLAGVKRDIIYYQRYPMPGSTGEIDQQRFFDNIVDFLEPVLTQDHRQHAPDFNGFTTLQFCFSYPVRIDETGEGYVSALSKEISIHDLVGKPLKQNLLVALKQRGWDGIKDVVILNDTTATLLAGCHEKTVTGKIDSYDGFLGIVWGTGFNIAYEENHFFAKPYVVNSEAGNCACFPMSPVDDEINRTSITPGHGLAEKKISGYYFAPMVKSLLQLFLDNHSSSSIFSSELREVIKDPQIVFKSEHISEFLLEKNDSGNPKFYFLENGNDTFRVVTGEDQSHLRYFIEHLARRSAYLTALITTALMLQSLGRDPLKGGEGADGKPEEKKRFCLVLDGSMIRKMPGLKEKFTDYLLQLGSQHHLEFETLEIDRAPIVGTAIARIDFS